MKNKSINRHLRSDHINRESVTHNKDNYVIVQMDCPQILTTPKMRRKKSFEQR